MQDKLSDSNPLTFDKVSTRYEGPELEKQILKFWNDHDMFVKCQQQSEGKPLFMWNDGPPTANGKPGIHHVLARTFKDIFPRYKHMSGHHCPRTAGWDTHGLPVEHEIEKELQIFDKKRIEEEVGIAEFNRKCRESVMRYIDDWEKMTERMGFWVDMKDAYYTLNNEYIESVWWLIKQIWDKNLIYQGYKVVPYDPRIGATLSSHEIALGGYKELEDPSIFVRFRLVDDENTSFLVWTTTPWTLPSNLALAVHPDYDYVYVRCGDETFILAEALIDSVLQDSPREVIRKVKGDKLAGIKYQRLFDYLPAEGKICQVYCADFVTIEDGTGIVHAAPAYGEDDLKLAEANGLPVVHGVGLDGYFLEEVTPVAGKFFKEADPIIVQLLTDRGLMYRAETFIHNYPIGWRTGDPLIYYAKHAWYIRTSQFRDRMSELNQTIYWVPENIRDGRFGNWLANNIDWALSRERFWGTPLPLWTDGDGDFICIGSVEELENFCGRSLREVDLHRPEIDNVSFTHPQNGRLYRRVPEVIDCWFDSGAMSYAQFHYPFENQELFTERFPADYIVEAIDQTRGWFYTLHAISTLVSDSVAYRNCICLAHIVDKNGKKMSKSLGNIIDPYDVFDSVGADALRWYMACRVAPEVQKRISVDVVKDVASSFINTWWNTYAFFILYAQLDGFDRSNMVPVAERPEIDRWIIAMLQQTVHQATEALDRYDVIRAGQAIERFVDALSNWYVRRNRRRFWKAEAGADKQAAYLTLYECLEKANRLMAPVMPFLAEAVYQNLVRKIDASSPVSVHMAEWPVVNEEQLDLELIYDVEVVRQIVVLGRGARNKTQVRTRQPLGRMLVRVPSEKASEAVNRHKLQILEELNVKSIELIARDAELVSYRILPNLPVLGKQHGKLIPAIREALAVADSEAIAVAVAANENFSLDVNGDSLTLGGEHVLVETESAHGWASAEEGGYLVGLDTRLNDELECEGLARELVRTIQESRKQAGLEVSDRIVLRIEGTDKVSQAVAEYKDYILEETLAVSADDANTEFPFHSENSLNAESWTIQLSKHTE